MMEQDDVTATLNARYRALEQLYADCASAEAIVDALFWPDLVTTAEGADRVYHGVDEVLPLARAFVGFMGRDVQWVMHDPVVMSGNLASSIMEVICRYDDGRPAAHFRAIYVWQKRGDTWKVLHEMVCNGPVN